MKCKNCGEINAPGNKFCIRCGSRLVSETELKISPEKAPDSEPEHITPDKSEKSETGLAKKEVESDSFEIGFVITVLKNAGLVAIIIALIFLMVHMFKEWAWAYPVAIFISGIIAIVWAEYLLRNKDMERWAISFEVAGFLAIFISFISALQLELINLTIFYILSSILSLISFLISFKSAARDPFYTLGITSGSLIFLNLFYDDKIRLVTGFILIPVFLITAGLVRGFVKKNKELDFFAAIFPFVAITGIGLIREYQPDLLLINVLGLVTVFIPELMKKGNFKYSLTYLIFSFLSYFLITLILEPVPALVIIFILGFTFQVLFCHKPYLQVWRTIVFFVMICIMVITGIKILEHPALDLLNAIYIILFTVMGILSIKKYALNENEVLGFKIYIRFLYVVFYTLMLVHAPDWIDETCCWLLLLIPVCYFTAVYIFKWYVDAIFASLLVYIGVISIFSNYNAEEAYWIGNTIVTIIFYIFALSFKDKFKTNAVIIISGTFMMLITVFDKFDGELGATLMCVPFALILLGFGVFYKKSFLRVSGIILILFAFGKGLIWDIKELDILPRVIGFLAVGLTMVGISYVYLKYPQIITGLKKPIGDSGNNSDEEGNSDE